MAGFRIPGLPPITPPEVADDDALLRSSLVGFFALTLKDPAVRARSDELYAQCRAVLDHCAPIVSDPLLPVRLVIERPPKGPCAEKQSPLVLSPLSLRERHVRVMRHLRERPALP